VRLGWQPAELASRRKHDPAKLEIAARLRREMTLSVKQIATRLHLGYEGECAAWGLDPIQRRGNPIKVRRWRVGTLGLGQGRPGWFPHELPQCLATGIVGSGSEYQQDGSCPIQNQPPPLGAWPEAAQRYFDRFGKSEG
jgi:hypothetical protein